MLPNNIFYSKLFKYKVFNLAEFINGKTIWLSWG